MSPFALTWASHIDVHPQSKCLSALLPKLPSFEDPGPPDFLLPQAGKTGCLTADVRRARISSLLSSESSIF